MMQRVWTHTGISLLLALTFVLGGVLTSAARPAFAASSVQLSRATAGSGDQIAVTGQGFKPNGTVVVRVDFDVNNVQRPLQVVTRVDGAGSFRTAFALPDGTMPHTYTVTARDFAGHLATQSLTVLRVITIKAGANSAAVSVRAGHQFFVRGFGFRAKETVRISSSFPLFTGNTLTETRSVQADSRGEFTDLMMSVPANARPGSASVSALGLQSNARAGATVNVLYRPSITVSSPSSRPGTSVTVHGSGFAANAGVHLGLLNPRNGTVINQRVTTNNVGDFSASVALPATIVPGSYSIIATGDLSGARVTTALIVTAHAAITVQPSSTSPGGAVTVTGTGFSANVRIALNAVVPLYGGGSRTVSLTVQTGTTGNFSTRLTLPANAAGNQSITISAQGPQVRAAAHLQIQLLAAGISVSSASVLPGSDFTVTGRGYPGGDRIVISATVNVTNGPSKTITVNATAGSNGQFVSTVQLPANSAGGTYTVTARSLASGRAPSARFIVTKLAPSIVAVPTTAIPGTAVKISGFGFARGQAVTITLDGQKVGTATTDGAGKFSTSVTIPASTASGSYTLSANSAGSRSASLHLPVQRQVSTHFYFASFYTGRGYHEYLALLNSTATRANVTISYQPTTGPIRTKTLTVAAHSRATEDVNVDLGYHVSAGAVVSSDVAIAAERVVYHNTDFTGGPGATSPSTSWYFANGNTSHNYREYLAIENPNSGPVQVVLHFLPTHHRAFTVFRNVAATSRTTVNVNNYVHRDAVGVTVTSNGPVVINRTIYIHHGITSKIGTTSPQRTWYFAAGAMNPSARQWIGAINTSAQASYVTLHTYGPGGQSLGAAGGWVKPNGRVGYLVNRIAHTPSASVVLTASQPVVAEQTTYVGRMHDASTDIFGVYAPTKNWQFAAVNTLGGQTDTFTLFNPNPIPVPVVVQFIRASGAVSQQTYVLAPRSQQWIDVAGIAPNAELGLVAASNYPFVAVNRGFANNRLGSETSSGTHF